MFDSESLLQYGGLLIVFLAVFCQTGLFFCFFLPSGALMFTAGVFVASGKITYSIITVCLLLIVAAISGNITGYAFGRKTGPLLYRRKDSRLFRRQHLQAAENFYQRYGGMALMAGMFLPIVRTFSPIVAGMISMKFRRFLAFTAIGSAAWILVFVLAGFLVGSMPLLKPFLIYIVLGIVVLVTLPIVIRIAKELRKRSSPAT
jgi:membrane-associated protein